MRIPFLPRSWTGWGLIILINVLLLIQFAQIISIEVISRQFAAFTQRDTIADRVDMLDRTLHQVPEGDWPRLIQAVSDSTFRVQFTDPHPELIAERRLEEKLLKIADQAERARLAMIQAAATQSETEAQALREQANADSQEALSRARAFDPDGNSDMAATRDMFIHRLKSEISRAEKPDRSFSFKLELPSFAPPPPPGPRATTTVTSWGERPVPEALMMNITSMHLEAVVPRKEGDGGRILLLSTQRISPFIRLWPGDRRTTRPFLRPAPDNPENLRVLLPISEKKWIAVDAGTAKPLQVDLGDTLVWFLTAGGLVSLLAGFAIVRLTSPLERFAKAAQRLARDVDAPPLPEKGPSEVRTAARAFNEMQNAVKRFVRDRTTMLAAISHDLRTPLTRLRLRGEFMDESQQEKYFRDLDEMEAMIKATMAFARDEASAEPATNLDLSGLLTELGGLMIEAGKPVLVTPAQDPVPVIARPMALKRVFQNLMENAVTYGRNARVALSQTKKDVMVTVDDDGPGIPEDQLEQVFAPFYRTEGSRNRSTGGVGLGLATVRSTVRAHGGDVTLENRPGGGLRATVRLPREAA